MGWLNRSYLNHEPLNDVARLSTTLVADPEMGLTGEVTRAGVFGRTLVADPEIGLTGSVTRSGGIFARTIIANPEMGLNALPIIHPLWFKRTLTALGVDGIGLATPTVTRTVRRIRSIVVSAIGLVASFTYRRRHARIVRSVGTDRNRSVQGTDRSNSQVGEDRDTEVY